MSLFAISLSLSSCGTFFNGGSNNNKDKEPDVVVPVTLESIRVKTPPTKTTYFVGERFDNTGLAIEAVYSDQSTKDIITYTIDKNEPLKLEDTKVTVSYHEKTCEIAITVIEKEKDDEFEEVKSSDIESIVIEEDGIDLHWGETYKINYSYLPSDARNPQFNLRSTNTTLATVSSEGVVTPTGKGEGTVEIVISHQNINGTVISERVTFNIIKRIVVTELIPSIKSAKIVKDGGKKSISVGYVPEDATETELVYTFDDPTIASMNETNTEIVGHNPGKTTLTISTLFDKDDAEATVAIEVLESGYVALAVDESLSPTKFGDYQDLEQAIGYDVLLSKTDGVKKAKIAVCPIEFDDYPFSSKTLSDLEIAFNGTGTNQTTGYWESVASYFKTASHGKLDLEFEILDVYKPNETSSEGVDDSNYYNKIPSYMSGCLRQHKANHSDFNYADYDYDSNGNLDSVWTIYSCPDYSELSSLSSNYWAFVTSTNTKITGTNYNIVRYGWASYDFMYKVGSSRVDSHTYIHETGHLLGLNDYYNYDDSSSANEPIGCFDMQSYNVGGHNSWSKVALGWENPVIYDASVDTYASVHLGKGNDGSCLFITNKYQATAFDEFLVVELYTPDGLNKLDSTYAYNGRAKMPSTFGAKIYHVDSRLIYGFSSTIGTETQKQKYIEYPLTRSGFPYGAMIGASNSSNYDRNYTHELFDQIALISSNKNGGAYMRRKTYSSAADFFQTGNVFTMEDYKVNFYNNEAKLNNGSSLDIKIKFENVTNEGIDLLIEPI